MPSSFVKVICALAALCASHAQAADLGEALEPSVEASESAWTGVYLGAGGGLNSLVSEINAKPGPSVASDPSAQGAAASFNGLGSSGSFATLSLGADYQLSQRWVMGAFGEYDFEKLGSDISLEVPGAPFSVHANVEADGKLSIGTRLGYLSSPTTLLFLNAGYSHLWLNDLRLNVLGSSPDISATVRMPSVSGVFGGAGVETKLTPHVSLRGEYRYTSFGSGPIDLPTIDRTNLNDIVQARLSPALQEGRASLNYRF